MVHVYNQTLVSIIGRNAQLLRLLCGHFFPVFILSMPSKAIIRMIMIVIKLIFWE